MRQTGEGKEHDEKERKKTSRVAGGPCEGSIWREKHELSTVTNYICEALGAILLLHEEKKV